MSTIEIPQRPEDFLLSIVAPAYNEEENITPFYERILNVLSTFAPRWEIVFVNDGSNDCTLQKITQLIATDNRVKLVNFSRNFGKEVALTAGLDYASGDAIVPIDVDLQDPPELIEQMIELWQQGYDVVYATRTIREGETWLKKATADAFYSFINKISSIKIPKNTGDFRLIDKRVLHALSSLRERNRFMKGLFSWVGFRQISLEYVRAPRFAGTSKFNYWKLWNFAIDGITSFSTSPLQIATYLGLLTSVTAFLYAIVIIAKTLILGADVPGYPSIMVSILFLGGIQLIFIGILGEYLGRIYAEVKGRPLYIVDSLCGLEAKN